MAKWVVAAGVLAGACLSISASGAVAAQSSSLRIVSAAPRLPNAATQLGPVASSAAVAGAVVLRPRDGAALTRFIAQVTDKSSPLFHRYLAPGAFAARFGPTPASIAAVTAQLRADGLTVSVARNGMLVDFRGSAAQVEGAFGVGLDRYRLADGSIGRARTAPVRLPAAIAGDVTSVVGLDNLVHLRPASVLRGSKTRTHAAAKTLTFPHPAGSPTPCADAQAVAHQFGGLTDDQIANAYGAFGLYGAGDVGAGQHIALYELEPFSTSDIETFDACYFGASQATAMLGRLTTISVDGGQSAGPGSGEALLDIQDVSAFAPGANIDVYEAPNTTFGALDEYARIVNDDADQLVSTSWGLCEQAVQEGEPGVLEAENLLFQQAAAQGQTVFAASGDQGSNDCNAFFATFPITPVLSVGDPASQPYVVAVGGTTIDNPTRPAAEHVWNDGAAWGAGGGGISASWPMPAWQLNSHLSGVNDGSVVSTANSFEASDLGQPGYAFCKSENPAGPVESSCRELPDVSAQADQFTGGITVFADEFGGWQTFGGTSSATPIWAALLAVTNDSATCQGNDVGFVSPLLYSIASSPSAYAASFSDITAGNNDPYGDSNLFPATTGYDMATGLGTPQLTQPGNAAGLAYYLCTAAASGSRPTVTGVSPGTAFTSAASTSVTITGTNFEHAGSADVAGVQVGGFHLPAGDFNVTGPTTMTATFPGADKMIPPAATQDGAGRVQVVVTLTDGESSSPNPTTSTFTYVDDNGSSQAIPAITSVDAFGGPDAGGNTVDIYGSGLTGATGVTFGGVAVAVADFSVLHDWEIEVTVPAYAGGTTVCAQDGSSYGGGENATNDVCQTQVVVSNANGASKTATILPLYEGDAAFNEIAVIPAPAGEEPAPAPTEYDYFPPPTITSISTDNGPFFLASENGDSVVTIKGTGLNFAGLDWVNVGDPTHYASQDFNLVTVTGTEIQFAAPDLPNTTVDMKTLPVSVQTLAGLSDPLDLTYAGVPSVTGVTATAGPAAGKPAGPDTGGTPIDVTGTGFTGQVAALVFADVDSPFSFGTQYNFTPTTDTDLTSATVQQNPAIVDVLVCTVTACSESNPPADLFLLYPPGDPKIDSIAPARGSPGRTVTITGENLGCTTGVFFGKVAAVRFGNAAALLDCGSTTTIKVRVPAGKAGKRVPVTVTTVEGDLTGFGPSNARSFTYTRALAQRLTVQRVGNGGGRVTSSPAGIACGKTCTHRFPYGKWVTLTATPRPGARFAGWLGACRGSGKCRVRMKGAESVAALFFRKS